MIAQLETPILPSLSSSLYKVEEQVQVFTAPHRTFFSSAIAYGLRIAGQGKPVLVVQFLKGGIGQGPHQTSTIRTKFRLASLRFASLY